MPESIAARLTDKARAVPDTDWHVDRLYDFAPDLGAGVLVASHSRYVVDLNRAPDSTPLYDGAKNTEVCPTTDFDFAALYRPGAAPEPEEVAERIETYWRPYHDALAQQLTRIKARFGIAILFDAHSIRSRVPRFFGGRLPDLNIGTAGGASAAPELRRRLLGVAESAVDFTSVLDGRFTGGYITRAYGRPAERVHAVQLELAQCAYMDEADPRSYRSEQTENIRAFLKSFLETLLAFARQAT